MINTLECFLVNCVPIYIYFYAVKNHRFGVIKLYSDFYARCFTLLHFLFQFIIGILMFPDVMICARFANKFLKISIAIEFDTKLDFRGFITGVIFLQEICDENCSIWRS